MRLSKVLQGEVGQLRQTIADLQHSTVASARAATRSPAVASLRLDDHDPSLGNRQAPVGISASPKTFEPPGWFQRVDLFFE